MIDKNITEKLIEKALEVRKKAYAPYSQFYVGAVLLTSDGQIYTGTNVENSSYPVGICAERNAISSAVSDGKREFKMLIIVGGKFDENSDELQNYCSPCGMCRQFIDEFCNKDFPVVIARSKTDYKVCKLCELLPVSFNI